jgi:protein-export membrane protein SecD
MKEKRFAATLLLIAGIAIGYFVYTSEAPGSRFPFRLGLDLDGGTHLLYQADISTIPVGEVTSTMDALRDVIERRVNLFGVSEPLVQVERSGVLGGGAAERLIVELPGITDVGEAVKMIGKTPSLEFRLAVEVPPEALAQLNKTGQTPTSTSPQVFYSETGLTGSMVKRAQLAFDQQTNEPKVLLSFTDEGAKLFAKITKENIGKPLGIFLDGEMKSAPSIRQEITSGSAEITGRFTPEEARTLVRDLNFGALPVPITLVSTQTVGATLGSEATKAGVHSGIIAFAVVALFLIAWYRLPGLVASIALFVYVILNLALFKLIPVTLTAAGIAAFVLSMGMAVDANILIFERMKEELAKGKSLPDAVKEGFARAWLSIRDSNLSSIITAIILFALASSNIIRGFALVFGIGVVTSMFTALTLSRSLLFAIGVDRDTPLVRFLFNGGKHQE